MEVIAKTGFIQNFRLLIQDFFSFLKHPQEEYPAPKSANKLVHFIYLHLLSWLFNIIAFAMMIGGLFLASYVFSSPVFHEVIIPGKGSRDISPLNVFLMGGIVAPVLEELMFRLHLRFSPLHLALSLALFCSFFLLPGQMYSLDVELYLSTEWWLKILGGLGIGAVLYFIFRRYQTSLLNFWKKHYFSVFYLTAIVFGVVHVLGKDITLYMLIMAPVATLPQIFSGLLLGYVRLRYGLLWSIALHGMANGVLVSMVEVILEQPMV